MTVNKAKSGILIIRADKKTPQNTQSIRGINVVEHYEYLGVHIDDSFSLKIQKSALVTKVNQFDKAIKMYWTAGLPPAAKYHVWQTLIVSRFAYGHLFLS